MVDMRKTAVPLAAAMLTAGCGLFEFTDDADTVQILEIDTVVLAMNARVNDDWPARVSLVRVDDVGLMNDLLHLDTRSWFADGGESFRDANPEAFYDDWEVVPGSRIGPFDVRVSENVGRRHFLRHQGEPAAGARDDGRRHSNQYHP